MNKVVMIYPDAFSSRYLAPDRMPFLARLADSSLTTLFEPMFAFTGIGVSTFTGAAMATHHVWADYVLGPPDRFPALLKRLLRLSDFVPDDILNQYARYALCRLFRVNPGTPNLIPLPLVERFSLKELSRLTSGTAATKFPTLFEWLKRHGVRYHVSGLYESLFEGYILRNGIRALSRDDSFVLLKFGSLDRLGHKYGPESIEMTRGLQTLDDRLNRLYEKAWQSGDRVSFIVFSDHGMSPVTEYIDLARELRGLPLRMPEDYLYFLNSTVAGFWFANGRAASLVTDRLSQLPYGMILGAKERAGLGLANIGPEYGDILFALKEGCVFFPDYYRRRRPPRGMHGFAYSNYDTAPFIVRAPDIVGITGPGTRARYIDVMPTILNLLGLPVPPTCEGRSLVKVGDVSRVPF